MSRSSQTNSFRRVAEAKKVGRALVFNRAGGLSEFDRFLAQEQAANPHGNIMEVLFLIFRESIEGTNEDRKLQLEKLQQLNDMSEVLSDYLDGLVDVINDLATEANRSRDSGGSVTKGSCDPARPTRIIGKLEKATTQLEQALRRVNPRDRRTPAIRVLADQIAYEKKVLARAKSVYAAAFRKK